MFWLIASIIVFLILFALLGVDRREGKWHLRPQQFASLGAFVLMGFSMVAIVPANSVGIVYSPFTGVSEKTLAEGWHTKGPFDQIYTISSEVQTKTLENITGQTKDAQYITMAIDVKYRVDTDKAFEVFKQYRTLDNVDTALINPTAQRSIEEITTKYNIIDVLGGARSEIYKGIETELSTRLASSGITFVSINFVDTQAPEEIETAITAEAVAKKAVETAEQELKKAETDAQQAVVKAQAEQDKAKIEAETKLIAAQAQAEANKLLADSLTDPLLREKWLEKWNGELPTVAGSDAAVIIDSLTDAPAGE